MKRIVYLLFIFFCSTCLLSPTVQAQLPHLIFHAELNGSEQIPAVNTNGKGLITIMYSPDRSKVNVTGLLVDIQGDITAVDLHIGKTGQVGALLVNLLPSVHGRGLYGEITVPATLLQNLLPDRVYVSVSTTAHTSGEIRGQFICETDLEYRGILTGSEAVPANASPAFGFGGIHFPTGSEDVVYAFLAKGLSSAITEIGIYEGAPGQNGPLVHKMIEGGGLIQGLITLGDLPPNFLRLAREGKYYFAIKTANFPDGEIRGQMGFQGYFTSLAPVNAVQNVPAQPSPGFGFSQNILNQTIDSLTSTVYISGVVPTSVDIHLGIPGMNGPLFQTLTPTSTPGLFRKTYALDPMHLTDFAEGRLYVNVKTAAHPNGEIRGVMKNSLRKGYAFDLCAEQVVPPTNSPAYGIGMASVDQANCYLNYKVIYDRLSGTPTEAFICQAFPTMNGNAIYPMPTTKPIIPGIQEIMSNHGVAIELGETYMLLVTNNYPNGEIRGQIKRGLNCEEQSGVSVVSNISEINVSPVPFKDVLNIAFDSQTEFAGRIVLYDILGVPNLSYPVQIVAGSQTLQIETGILTPGYYSMMLESAAQTSSMLLKKLIKE